jgi:hypothetical protein
MLLCVALLPGALAPVVTHDCIGRNSHVHRQDAWRWPASKPWGEDSTDIDHQPAPIHGQGAMRAGRRGGGGTRRRRMPLGEPHCDHRTGRGTSAKQRTRTSRRALTHGHRRFPAMSRWLLPQRIGAQRRACPQKAPWRGALPAPVRWVPKNAACRATKSRTLAAGRPVIVSTSCVRRS